MTFGVADILTYLLGAAALAGALAVVLTRKVIYLILGLGAVLLSTAGLFGVAGARFLAVAEVFVYVGGVLVLFLFSIMLVHRSESAEPSLESRHDFLSLVVAFGLFLLVVTAFTPAVEDLSVVSLQANTDALAQTLLGPMLVHFEVAGFVLLAALVAVIAILAKEDRQ